MWTHKERVFKQDKPRGDEVSITKVLTDEIKGSFSFKECYQLVVSTKRNERNNPDFQKKTYTTVY